MAASSAKGFVTYLGVRRGTNHRFAAGRARLTGIPPELYPAVVEIDGRHNGYDYDVIYDDPHTTTRLVHRETGEELPGHYLVITDVKRTQLLFEEVRALAEIVRGMITNQGIDETVDSLLEKQYAMQKLAGE